MFRRSFASSFAALRPRFTPPHFKLPHNAARPASTSNRIPTSKDSMASDLKFIATDKAAPIAGPYSQAVSHPHNASTLYISGQLPALTSGELVTDRSYPEQAKACIANLEGILKAAHPGATLRNIVKCNVFITDMANFGEFNKGYEEAFGTHRPARSCVAVRELPKGVPIEIEAIAVI